MLLLELLGKLLFDNVFVVETLDALSFVFDSTLRIGCADHLTCQIDLGFEAVLRLLCILASQLFSLFHLSGYELVLPRLEVLIVALI